MWTRSAWRFWSAPMTDRLRDAARRHGLDEYAVVERAAIMEYCGRMTQEDAERAALADALAEKAKEGNK